MSAGPGREGPGRRRFLGVDAARGLALVAMMTVHVLPGTDPDGAISRTHQIAAGRSAATFAVLAGVGLALASGGERPQHGRRAAATAAAVAVRALLIAAIGLALGAAGSGVAVILVYYALLFAVALPLLRLRAPALAAIALAVAVVVPVLSHALRDGDALPFNGANPTLGTLVESPLLLLRTLALLGYYPVLAWLAYACAGLAAGRLALRERRVAAGLLCCGAALAVAAWAGSRLLLGPLGGRAAIVASTSREQVTALLERHDQFGNTPTDTWWWLVVDSPHSSTPPDLLHTTGVALAVLGAMLLLAATAAGPILGPLAAAGSMPLTMYCAHVLMLASDALPADPQTSFGLQLVVLLALAMLWRRYVGRGPLEQAISAVSSAVSRVVASPRD